MSASPETRAARKTRGGFACCSRRATHTQSEAGDVQTDPLSPIKPEEAAEATELGVEAVIAEEEEATVQVEPEDATPDVSCASTPVSAASTVSFAERAGFEREGSTLDGERFPNDVFDEDPSVDAIEDDDEKTRAVAAALASSIMAEADDASDDLDAPSSDVAARDRDVASDVSFEGEGPVTFEDEPTFEDATNATNDVGRRTTFVDETMPLLKTANGDANVDPSTDVSSTSEDEKALLVSVHGTAKRRQNARDDSASFEEQAQSVLRRSKTRGFFARNFSAKSAVLAATTFAVCAACTAGVLTLRFATPRATVVAGPDAEALAASESLSVPSRAAKRSGGEKEEAKKHAGAPSSATTKRKKSSATAAKTRAKTQTSHLSSETKSLRDGKKHAKSSSSKVSSSSSKVSSSSSSPPSAKRTAHVAKDADADADVPSLGLRTRGGVECVSALGEARHGVHMQMEPDAAALGGAACQRCYLKGTPAETQKNSMGWCRASVCERLELTKTQCAPEDASGSGRENGTSEPSPPMKRATRRHGPSGAAATTSDVFDESDAQKSDALGAKAKRSSSSERRSRRGGEGSPSDDPTGTAVSKKSTRKTSEESLDESNDSSVARRVGRCVAEPGDADFGRYVWEDPSCSHKKHSGAGCVDLGTHHCRFCVAEVRDGNDSGELGIAEGSLATCPWDVCDVHNLFWELCDES